MLLFRWALVLIYLLGIFLFSASPESGASTMNRTLLDWFPFLVNYNMQEIVFFLRKTIHVAGYFLATVLVFYASSITPYLKRQPYLVAGIVAFGFAVADEWYQTMLPHRTGTFTDVLIDLIGIVLALAVFFVKEQLIERKKAPATK